MRNKIKAIHSHQRGLGLPEILVGLAIGLIVTLVIVQVMGEFEGQKRTTTGGADAQTNGSVALNTIQRRLQAAGFGLPIYSSTNTALKCDPVPTIDQDNNATTPPIGIFPVTITDGGDGGASDTIAIRAGTSAMGGAPIRISNVISATNTISVTNNLGCANGDIALISSIPNCTLKKVVTASQIDTTQIVMNDVTGVNTNAMLACLGAWNEIVYQASGGNLTESGVPSVAGIVNIQAQYGISATPNDNVIANWVNASSATGWDNPTVTNRNRIKAIRIAVVARSDLKEKLDVTAACTAPNNAKGPCSWPDSATDPAPLIDLATADADWKRYRYRIFTTIIPLRNIIWSKALL